jgi:hypothetical protein
MIEIRVFAPSVAAMQMPSIAPGWINGKKRRGLLTA